VIVGQHVCYIIRDFATSINSGKQASTLCYHFFHAYTVITKGTYTVNTGTPIYHKCVSLSRYEWRSWGWFIHGKWRLTLIHCTKSKAKFHPSAENRAKRLGSCVTLDQCLPTMDHASTLHFSLQYTLYTHTAALCK
jgi:hypothetical protein